MKPALASRPPCTLSGGSLHYGVQKLRCKGTTKKQNRKGFLRFLFPLLKKHTYLTKVSYLLGNPDLDLLHIIYYIYKGHLPAVTKPMFVRSPCLLKPGSSACELVQFNRTARFFEQFN